MIQKRFRGHQGRKEFRVYLKVLLIYMALKHTSMTPHNLWTARRKAEVQPWTDDG